MEDPKIRKEITTRIIDQMWVETGRIELAQIRLRKLGELYKDVLDKDASLELLNEVSSKVVKILTGLGIRI